MNNLIVYKKSLDLVKKVYLLIENNSSLKKDYSLTDQLKRAAVSISLNISEGCGRSDKTFSNFLKISIGSSNEVMTILEIVEMIYDVKTVNLRNEFLYLVKQLSQLSKKVSSN